MNWTAWKRIYQRQLDHIAGYEEKFVDLVLSQIPNLDPSDVIPQYHFTDDGGKNRYIDFMIINQSKNWLLPIELDGYAKMVGNGNDYARFQDFLERQNALVKQFGLVLRYTNKTMFNQSTSIIHEITDVLNRQSQYISTRDIQESNTKQMVEDTSHKSISDKELIALLSQMRQDIADLTHTQPSKDKEQVESLKSEPEPTSKLTWFMAILFFGFFLVPIVATFLQEKEVYYESEQPVPAYNASVEAVKQAIEESLETSTETSTDSTSATAKQTPKSTDKIKESTAKAVSTNTIKSEPVPTKTEKPKQEPAKFTVGKVANVCGKVSEVKYNPSQGNNYLNINGKFPNQEITFTVWINEDLSNYTGKKICTYGEVQEYKGRLSINVNSLKGLKEK